MKFRNFGKKSFELDELVAFKNLNFGMDLAKYKLDRINTSYFISIEDVAR
jgi:DNA-directed RNA polymerase subunit alpha